MTKSIVAGLALSAVLGLVAGQALADDNAKKDGAPAAHRAQAQKPPRTAETRTAATAPAPLFRIPAHPVVRDCVHVMFPQCSRGYDGLNDGTYGRY
jgi:hypothetical protein